MGHSLDGSNNSLSKSMDSRSGFDGFPPSPIWVGGSDNKNGSDLVYLGCGNAGEEEES